VRITGEALKHGITLEQIRQSLQVPMRTVPQDDSRVLVIGADDGGRLLEIVIADLETDEARVIHAMPLRRKFYHYL